MTKISKEKLNEMSAGLLQLRRDCSSFEQSIEKIINDIVSNTSEEENDYQNNLVRFEEWDRYPKKIDVGDNCQDWKIFWHDDNQCHCDQFRPGEQMTNNHYDDCQSENYIERYCRESDHIYDQLDAFKEELWEKDILAYEDEGSTDDDYLDFLFSLKIQDRYPLVPSKQESFDRWEEICHSYSISNKNLLCGNIG